VAPSREIVPNCLSRLKTGDVHRRRGRLGVQWRLDNPAYQLNPPGRPCCYVARRVDRSRIYP